VKTAQELWNSLQAALVEVGAMVRFLIRLLIVVPRALLRFSLVAEQIYNAGALSLVIIMLSVMFFGMVLGLQ
jgi:phospholipid/cholesterol/gamma-HCH transport system permease protein